MNRIVWLLFSISEYRTCHYQCPTCPSTQQAIFNGIHTIEILAQISIFICCIMLDYSTLIKLLRLFYCVVLLENGRTAAVTWFF